MFAQITAATSVGPAASGTSSSASSTLTAWAGAQRCRCENAAQREETFRSTALTREVLASLVGRVNMPLLGGRAGAREDHAAEGGRHILPAQRLLHEGHPRHFGCG